MNKKFLLLISLLTHSTHPITSESIATKLSISTRSVRNYVKEINSLLGSEIIKSSNKGYFLTDLFFEESIQKKWNHELANLNAIPNDSQSRSNLILFKLLREENINVFDLCSSLFISYASLRKIISEINANLKQEHLSLYLKTNKESLTLVGEEKEKRVLFSKLIYGENTSSILDINYLSTIFGEKTTTVASDEIKKLQNEYSFDDFKFLYILLHLLIVINRSSYNKTSNNKVSSDSIEIPMVTRSTVLIKSIEEKMNIKLSNIDKKSINTLLVVNINSLGQKVIADYENSLSNFQSLISSITETVQEYYGIDLDTKEFIDPFKNHLYALLLRTKSNVNFKNPLTKKIKTDFPILFDIATHISHIINKEWLVKLNADEISLIALHIGTSISSELTNSNFKVLIILPDNLRSNKNLLQDLQYNFPEIDFTVKSITDYNSYLSSNIDGIITTEKITIDNKYQIPILEIPLLSSVFNKQQLNTQLHLFVSTIEKNKRKLWFDQQFDYFFKPELFFEANTDIEKLDIIHLLSSNLEKLGYVDSEFENQVLDRENMSSTNFDNIAIPHTFKFISKKSGIAILLPKNGNLLWDNKKVSLVLLLSINYDDRDKFMNLYTSLIDLLTNAENISKLSESKSFSNFKKVFLKNL